MEVFLILSALSVPFFGLLHARGGVSEAPVRFSAALSSSPRSWRCFLMGVSINGFKRVFSTLVEVFPVEDYTNATAGSLLHARGGVSVLTPFIVQPESSSPRSWRCFLQIQSNGVVDAVFSTLVEVFLQIEENGEEKRCLLHARGGVSHDRRAVARRRKSSPRSWRCFYPIASK